jgi:hypothetical protein
VYADLKINLILPEQEGNTYSIEASTQVERVNYCNATSYQRYQPATDTLQGWHGYGQYQGYIPHE